MMISNVFSKDDLRQLGKRALLATLLLLALIAFGLILNVVTAKRAEKSLEMAADFPRGALVYAQFQDLPALLKQMKESPMTDRFLGSVNQKQFWTRHLAIKLFARWEEFNAAAGFPIDLGAFSTLADNRAAIAVYDIGKLDLIFIAPMSEAKFAACRFVQGKDRFEKAELPDGTIYYLRDVEADRGRQKQHIAFAGVKGRFVLATSEKLLLRAIANLNGQEKKDRLKDSLTDEPSFQTLSKTIEPHFVTVWVEQTKLNDDWYFKHYWLMSEVDELKNIRAGMFDLEMQAGKWIERREFLLNGNAANAKATLSKQMLQTVETIVPADVPFVQLRSIAGKANETAELVSRALFDGKVEKPGKEKRLRWDRYSDSEFEVSAPEGDFADERRYTYLDSNFDSMINEGADGTEANDSELRFTGEQKFARTLLAALQSSRPLSAATLARLRAIDGPLFAEFARASVISLQNPTALNRQLLERSIGELAANRLMIAGAFRNALGSNTGGKFEWKSRNEQGTEWREMELPVLGRAVGYGVRGSELIVSNNLELLASLMINKGAEQRRLSSPSAPVHELTVIRLNQREAAFDQIFARLEEPLVKAYWQKRKGDDDAERASEPSQEFFSGEIASLLDVASPVEEVRIQRSYAAGRLREEVVMVLR